MNKKSLNDIHLKLLAALPIQIDGFGDYSPLTLREIISMGEMKYQQILSSVLFSKKNLANIKKLEELSDFETLIVYLYYDQSFRKVFFNGVKMFSSYEPKLLKTGEVLLDADKNLLLTEEMFTEFQLITRLANCIEEEKEDEYEAGNEQAKKFIEKLEKKKKDMPKNEKVNLHSLISGVAWKGFGFDEVLNLTMYQLYDGIRRIDQIEQYQYTLTGIYTGNVDSKKIKLSDINWANILNKK